MINVFICTLSRVQKQIIQMNECKGFAVDRKQYQRKDAASAAE